MTDDTCTIDGCEKPYAQRGWCWMHYQRWRKHRDLNNHGAFIVGDDEARFLSYVEQRDGHWHWTGSLNASGYGVFRADGMTVLAHRWAYEHWVGPIPGSIDGERATIDHLCRIRECVQPSCLEPVTDAVNVGRSLLHYGARTHCKQGHEFTPENTSKRSDGGRRCLTCKRERSKNKPTARPETG